MAGCCLAKEATGAAVFTLESASALLGTFQKKLSSPRPEKTIIKQMFKKIFSAPEFPKPGGSFLKPVFVPRYMSNMRVPSACSVGANFLPCL
jgi:hypothetical protein